MPTSNTSLASLQVSETFVGSGARQSARVSSAGIGSIASGKAGFDGSVSVAYDHATGRYTVSDAGSSRVFAPGDRSSADSNATITVYEQTSGTRTDHLALFNPGAANGVLALSYVSYGAWQTMTDNSPSSIDFQQRFFVFGVREASSIPTSGTGTYTTTVDGFWTTSGGLYSLAGTGSFTADFGALTVSTGLSLTGTDITDATGTRTQSLGTFAGTGSITRSNATFTGTLAHQGADAGGTVYSGTFDGALFGPGAAEMGYTFRVTGSNGVAVGAVVGKKN